MQDPPQCMLYLSEKHSFLRCRVGLTLACPLSLVYCCPQIAYEWPDAWCNTSHPAQFASKGSEIMNDTSSEHQLGQSIISIQRDDILEEIKFDTPSMEI